MSSHVDPMFEHETFKGLLVGFHAVFYVSEPDNYRLIHWWMWNANDEDDFQFQSSNPWCRGGRYFLGPHDWNVFDELEYLT